MSLQLRKRLHGGKGDNGERMSITGWALLFHPDRLGFEYTQHFSRMFKKSEGITPPEYRQRLHSR